MTLPAVQWTYAKLLKSSSEVALVVTVKSWSSNGRTKLEWSVWDQFTRRGKHQAEWPSRIAMRRRVMVDKQSAQNEPSVSQVIVIISRSLVKLSVGACGPGGKQTTGDYRCRCQRLLISPQFGVNVAVG